MLFELYSFKSVNSQNVCKVEINCYFIAKLHVFLTLDGISKKKHDSFITYSLLQYAIIFATEQVG